MLELIHAQSLKLAWEALLLDQNQTASAVLLVTLNNFGLIVRPSADDISFKGVPHQLSTVAIHFSNKFYYYPPHLRSWKEEPVELDFIRLQQPSWSAKQKLAAFQLVMWYTPLKKCYQAWPCAESKSRLLWDWSADVFSEVSAGTTLTRDTWKLNNTG